MAMTTNPIRIRSCGEPRRMPEIGWFGVGVGNGAPGGDGSGQSGARLPVVVLPTCPGGPVAVTARRVARRVRLGARGGRRLDRDDRGLRVQARGLAGCLGVDLQR